MLGEASKKKTVFFRKNSERGGGISPNPKFPYQKKMRFFWIFFSKGGGSHLFQKSVIIKTGDSGIFLPKERVLPHPLGFYHKKLRKFWNFSPKGGGVSPIPKFPYQKKLDPPNCWEGGLGISEFFRKKTVFFFLMPPLR